MDTTPLPTQDCDLNDSDQQSQADDLVHYVARVTAYEKFTFDQLKAFLETEFRLLKYVVAQELVPQVHYHIVLTTDESFTIQDAKDTLRAFLYPLWCVEGKLPRGWGNKQYNCQASTNVDQAISYALKDKKEYHYVGWPTEYIEQKIAASFTKKDTKSFNTELQELRNVFQTTDMDINNFMVKFVQLKSRYNQMVNLSHAYQYALSQLIQRNPEEAESFVINFLYKQ